MSFGWDRVSVSLSSSFFPHFTDSFLCFVSAEYGFSCLDPAILGISLDLKTIHDSAPDYKFGKENPRNPRLKDYVLSPSGVARISEVRADPWDSASSPEAVPVKVVLPDLRTTSDPVSVSISRSLLFVFLSGWPSANVLVLDHLFRVLGLTLCRVPFLRFHLRLG